MFGEMGAREVELLNSFEHLSSAAQRELQEYVRYLLCKQYKREVMVTVFNNKLLHTLLHSLLHMVEREEMDIDAVARRINQVKEMYYAIFEQVHIRYCELIEDLDSNETVKEFGRTSFDNLDRALRTQSANLIRLEIVDFCQGYDTLGRRKDARKIVAV